MTSHTLRAILCICSLLLIGCSTSSDKSSQTLFDPNPSKVFVASYDEVWRAVQKAFIRYPIQINNIDLGTIETDVIKGKPIWQSPVPTKFNRLNAKYTIQVLVVRGTSRGKDSTRVTINKNISIEKDFFSGSNKLVSDGYEELALLYRIEREIQIERSLRRAFEKNQI